MPPASATLGALPKTLGRKGVSAQSVTTTAFCDTFDTFDTTRWNTYSTPGYWSFYNTQGTYEAANTSVENGHLVLKVQYESGDVTSTTAPAVYRSAVVESAQRMGYGTYDAWVRMSNTSKDPAVNGATAGGTFTDLHNFVDIDYTDAYTKPDTLIESKYGYGTPNDLIYTTYKTNQPETTTPVYTPQNLSQGFHHHRWEWTPTALKFYIDDVLVHSVTDPNLVPSEAAYFYFNQWPVNKPDWNMPGSTDTRYTLVDKFCFTPADSSGTGGDGTAFPDPSTQPVSVSAPVSTAGDALTFDVTTVDANAYLWTFSDGTTAEGPAVEHVFSNPGTHTATVTVSRTSGESQTYTSKVAVLPKLDRAFATRNLSESHTVSWDLGEPLPGFGYQVSLGDGTVSTQSKGSHTYQKIGTYTVDLQVTDNRSLTGQSVRAGALQSQATTAPVVYRDRTWVTDWRRTPKAKFTMDSQNGAGNVVAIGTLPHTVTFDAASSVDENVGINPLTYDWDFGDSTTATGQRVSKTYTAEGRYQVTLTVTNSFGLKDTYRAFVYANDKRANIRLNVQNAAVSSQSLDAPTPPAGGKRLTAQASSEVIQYFPYVLPSTNRVTNGIFRVRTTNGDITNTYCSTIQIYVNGAERYGLKMEKTELGQDPYTGEYYFCDGVIYQSGTIARVPVATLNTILTTSSQYMNTMYVSTLQSLAVPRVTVSVFPDEYLPGDLASPVLKEYTIQNEETGETEWLLNVRVRQSEVKNGSISFKVPTMALDANGRFMTTVNGRFNTRFNSTLFTSDCGDCVMVNGRGSITVTMPMNTFLVGQAALDLSQVTVLTEGGGCASTGSTVGYYTLVNCANVSTTYKYPTGNAPVIAAYPYPAHTKFLGHLVFGETADAVEKFRTYTREGIYEDLKDFVLDPIPFLGSGNDFMEAVDAMRKNGVSGSSVVGVFLSGLGIVADVAPALGEGYQRIYKVFKTSKLGEGSLARAVETDTLPHISSRNNPDGIYNEIDLKYGEIGVVGKSCGIACVSFLDDAAKNDLPSGMNANQFFEKINGKLKLPKVSGLDDVSKLTIAEISELCPANELIKTLAVRTGPYVCKPTFVDFVKTYSYGKSTKYGSKTSDDVAQAFRGELQAHHGLQQEWAVQCLNKTNFPSMTGTYDPALAPAVMLETNSNGGFNGKSLGLPTEPRLPHTLVTREQNRRSRSRGGNFCASSLRDELINSVGDLLLGNLKLADVKCVMIFNYDMLTKLGLQINNDFFTVPVDNDIAYNGDQSFRDGCYSRVKS